MLIENVSISDKVNIMMQKRSAVRQPEKRIGWENIMTLLEGKKGKNYIVEKMELPRATEIRLQAMGLTQGTRLHLQNRKRSGAVIFIVRGTRLAVGKAIASAVFVQEDKEKEAVGNE